MGFSLGSTLFSTLGVVLSMGNLVLVQSQYMVDKTKVVEDKTLLGYSFRNFTKKTVDECFFHCYEDCFCTAFEMCQNTECKLLSSSQYQFPSALVTRKGCSYYDMLHDLQQINKMNATGCNPVSHCQFHDYLCQNGGSYVPLTPTNYATPRYKCQCSTGYTGRLCQYVIKSCNVYSNGPRIPGKYQVFDDNMNPFEVFCDFDLIFNKVWTLVTSYQLQNKDTFDEAFYEDLPVNEDTPRWDEYRLSKSRMESIQNDSSIFRVTCNYDTDGLVYDDFLAATKKHIDILSFRYRHTSTPHVCQFVDYINIRGQDCAYCTMLLYQDSYILHTDSSKIGVGCEFQPTGAEECEGAGEDNFGHYNCVNSAHRCSSSGNATTQVWLGTSWL